MLGRERERAGEACSREDGADQVDGAGPSTHVEDGADLGLQDRGVDGADRGWCRTK